MTTLSTDHSSNGHVVPITPRALRLHTSFPAPRRKPHDQLLAWALFGTVSLLGLLALIGFCVVLYFIVLFVGGLARQLGGAL